MKINIILSIQTVAIFAEVKDNLFIFCILNKNCAFQEYYIKYSTIGCIV